MNMALPGKTAVVTGGTTGIGLAVARTLLEAGARVMVSGQDEGRVAAAARQLGDGAIGVVADNRSVAAIDRLAGRAREAFGRLDILVANAGVTWISRIDEVTERLFDDQMAINFKGNLFAVQKCLPLMPRGASIVMTSSCNDA